MNKEDFITALKAVKEQSPKRNFKQTIDLILNIRGVDLKKPDNQLDFFTTLHFQRGKKVKVCGFVGPEIAVEAKKILDGIVNVDDFQKYQQDKRLVKKLAKDFDVFIAQATIMPKVAASFGRVLGPKQKMPNPKAGCVVPPNPAVLKPTYEKLQKQVKVSIKTSPLFQCGVGTEDMSEDEVLDNIMSIYNQVIHHLPAEQQNIKSVFLKTTMGPTIKVGKDEEYTEEENKSSKKAKKSKPKSDNKKADEKSIDGTAEDKEETTDKEE